MDPSRRAELIAASKTLISCGQDDWDEIERLWASDIKQTNSDAGGDLAYLYFFYGFDEGAVKTEQMRRMAELAATDGHADAAYALAWNRQDEAQRDAWMLRAGQLGNRDAQRHLGAVYSTGDWSGPKDPALGVYWYTLAAEQGESDAQYNLGFMYLLGEGTSPNVEAGLMWLRRSAGQAHLGAIRLLADVYRNGFCGVPQHNEEAQMWESRLLLAEQDEKGTEGGQV